MIKSSNEVMELAVRPLTMNKSILQTLLVSGMQNESVNWCCVTTFF